MTRLSPRLSLAEQKGRNGGLVLDFTHPWRPQC